MVWAPLFISGFLARGFGQDICIAFLIDLFLDAYHPGTAALLPTTAVLPILIYSAGRS